MFSTTIRSRHPIQLALDYLICLLKRSSDYLTWLLAFWFDLVNYDYFNQIENLVFLLFCKDQINTKSEKLQIFANLTDKKKKWYNKFKSDVVQEVIDPLIFNINLINKNIRLIVVPYGYSNLLDTCNNYHSRGKCVDRWWLVYQYISYQQIPRDISFFQHIAPSIQFRLFHFIS